MRDDGRPIIWSHVIYILYRLLTHWLKWMVVLVNVDPMFRNSFHDQLPLLAFLGFLIVHLITKSSDDSINLERQQCRSWRLQAQAYRLALAKHARLLSLVRAPAVHKQPA